jgi:hypothetical protein
MQRLRVGTDALVIAFHSVALPVLSRFNTCPGNELGARCRIFLPRQHVFVALHRHVFVCIICRSPWCRIRMRVFEPLWAASTRQLVGSLLTGLLLAGSQWLSLVRLVRWGSLVDEAKAKFISAWGVGFLGSNLFGEGVESWTEADYWSQRQDIRYFGATFWPQSFCAQMISNVSSCFIGGTSWLDANDAVLNGAGSEVAQFWRSLLRFRLLSAIFLSLA